MYCITKSDLGQSFMAAVYCIYLKAVTFCIILPSLIWDIPLLQVFIANV